MKRSANVKGFMLLIQLAAMMIFMSSGIAVAAETITLAASEPAVIYYTTNGAAPTALTIDADAEKIKNEKKNKELKKKLLKKYDLDKELLTVKLEHTDYGPKGRLILSGEILPSNKSKQDSSSDSKPSKNSNAENMAFDFVEEEADMLGITNLNEIKMTKKYMSYEKTHTHIIFRRYINEIPLFSEDLIEWYLHVIVGPSNQITSVSAVLIPVPPELYEAAKKETIPEAQAREIAEVALRELNYDANTNLSIRRHMRASKVAFSSPPYVLWKVESYWNIFIDAFSGAVVEKVSNVRR